MRLRIPDSLEKHLKAIGVRARPLVYPTRRLSAAVGVILLLGLAGVPEGSQADRLALTALIVLSLATALGWLEYLAADRPNQLPVNLIKKHSLQAWVVVTIVVVVVAGLAAQTWFRPGTALGGGDVVPPNGTAWIGRLFEPWTWGGSTLGEPNQLPLRLPWAAIFSLAHAFGGDAVATQRIWDTTFYIGAGLAALSLLAFLRMGPVAALAGTSFYLLNPYTGTWVAPYDVYITALFLLPATLAVLVAAGTRRLSVWWSATLIAAASPLVGFAFSLPPLVGMILVGMLSAPLVVAWVDGKDAGMRSLRALLLAIPLLLATSAYWIVPAIVHLAESHLSSSAILLGFNWTAGELRTTIRNAFWLNTRWMWIAPEYFPYARAYDVLPLSALKFFLPALAFSALALARLRRRNRSSGRDHNLRLAFAAATAALPLIFISTGTKPPGNIVFDRLYSLPFGWLLQEPERFIMVVALVYAVLIAIVVDALLDHQAIADLMSARRFTVPTLRLSIASLALATTVLVGFPLYSGALVPDTGSPLPIWANHARPQHIQMPAYWAEMAQVTDALPIQGAVLVMPPDDFYEMPYTWYYGSDAFIADSFKRRVLVPSYPPSELLSAVNLAGQSMLDGDWTQVVALLTALNAPLVLVRRDVITHYPNHSILPPYDLAAALTGSPNFVLVRRIGSLDLFALRNPVAEREVGSGFIMTTSQTPDLRLLSVLPSNTALVTGEAHPGDPYAVQAPRLEQWQWTGQTLMWEPQLPSGWAYRIAELASKTVVPLEGARTFTSSPQVPFTVVYSPTVSNNVVKVSTTGRTVISNGDFQNGLWETVSDCNALAPTQAKPLLGARVLLNAAPGGLPALQLSASLDSACERQALNWRGGSLLLNMMVNHIEGANPQVCLWETGPERCATLPPISGTSGWLTYRASVSPDAGTTALTLHLYADASRSATRTINEYADVRAVEVPILSSFALLATPNPQPASSTQLVVVHSSFSTTWQGPPGSKHVLVDGMLNGWLVPSSSRDFAATYKPANAVQAANWISLAAYLLVLLVPIGRLTARNAGRLRGRRWILFWRQPHEAETV
jgi:hypothetical protein